MKHITIFIDESGTLPDKLNRFIVLAGISSDNAGALTNLLSKFRQKIPGKGKRKQERKIKEFKFHYVGEITRKKVLIELVKKNIKIYLLIVDKLGRKIEDSPQNFAKLVVALIKVILTTENIVNEVYIDKHFNKEGRLKSFQTLLDSIFVNRVKCIQIDSVEDSRIDLADFVAGAILRKYQSNDSVYSDIISSSITKEVFKKWTELEGIKKI